MPKPCGNLMAPMYPQSDAFLDTGGVSVTGPEFMDAGCPFEITMKGKQTNEPD